MNSNANENLRGRHEDSWQQLCISVCILQYCFMHMSRIAALDNLWHYAHHSCHYTHYQKPSDFPKLLGELIIWEYKQLNLKFRIGSCLSVLQFTQSSCSKLLKNIFVWIKSWNKSKWKSINPQIGNTVQSK